MSDQRNSVNDVENGRSNALAMREADAAIVEMLDYRAAISQEYTHPKDCDFIV
jgi:hypothetical protein